MMLKLLTRGMLLSCLLISSLVLARNYEHDYVDKFDKYTRGMLHPKLLEGLTSLINPNAEPPVSLPLPNCGPFPVLFEQYPGMKTTVPYRSLGLSLPTPVVHCKKLAAKLGVRAIYIKDDGQTGRKDGIEIGFGGNKPRKLQFLLAEAEMTHADAIITRGGTGSNFALAAAAYAKQVGIKKRILVLANQDNSYTVQRNLLLMGVNGAEIIIMPNRICNFSTMAVEAIKHKQKTGKFPYPIPTGGSCPLGAVGFVDAAFELKRQIDAGELQKPDYIYLAAGNGTGGTIPGHGSCGTSTGLLLGLQAAGLSDIHLVLVHVEPETVPGELIQDVKAMYQATNELLHKADPTFRIFPFPTNYSEVKEFCGPDYGVFTQEAMEARALVYETEHFKLDGVYTGKAAKGMFAMIEKNKLHDKVHLFWSGYCSKTFDTILKNANYKQLLPLAAQRYFETPVQPFETKF